MLSSLLWNLEYKFGWLRILNSPFKFPQPIFHLGKIRVGAPYMLPRRWVKNKENPGYLKSIPSWWFKLDFVGLGYKTKWTKTDYRHEYDPVWSFVFFGLQIAIRFHLNTFIWESWLVYDKCTKGVTENRLRKCRKINPNVWTSNKGNTDYFLEGLKDKYKNAFTK